MQLSSSTEAVTKLLFGMRNDVTKSSDNVITKPEAEKIIKVFDELSSMGWLSFTSNRLPLLKLPEEILEALRQGRIEYTKARAIAQIKDDVARTELLEIAIAEGLSLKEIPVVIRELTDEQAWQLALIENLQREDLNPVEEIEGILQLLSLRLQIASKDVPAILSRLQNEDGGKTTNNVISNSEREIVEQVFVSLGFKRDSFLKPRTVGYTIVIFY
ncbi:MAG: hypothetical protein WBB28_08555 [Crinalium sp.]